MVLGLVSCYLGIQIFEIVFDGSKILGGCVGWIYQGFYVIICIIQGMFFIDLYIKLDFCYYVVYWVEDNF